MQPLPSPSKDHTVIHYEGAEPIRNIATVGSNMGTVNGFSFDGHLLLIPSPTEDPNDPLNWPDWYKWIITVTACGLVFFGTFVAAGPATALQQIAQDFDSSIQKSAYLITVAPLMMGVALIGWSPLIAKFGKRPSYIVSTALTFAFTCWSARAKSWSEALVARILLGCAVAAAEGLGPLTISDLWFVHQRAFPLGAFSASLNIGSGLGSVMGGVISYNTKSWRNFYWLCSGMCGFLFLLVIFSFPETAFKREPMPLKHADSDRKINKSNKYGYWRTMRFSSGIYTEEGIVQLCVRPAATLFLPAVLWASLVYAGTVSFIVAISTNLPSALSPPPYMFNTQQIGLVYFSIVIGSLLALIIGGPFIDTLSHKLTKFNQGIREPEMRLPSLLLPLLLAPIGLVLYGVGFEKKLKWIVPTVGLGMLSFAAVFSVNIVFAYVVDCYKPIASEAIAGLMALKAIFGFIISFYTNTWVADQSYDKAFGEMAAISAALLMIGVLFYMRGKHIRQSIMRYNLYSSLRWNDDRDDLVIEQ